MGYIRHTICCWMAISLFVAVGELVLCQDNNDANILSNNKQQPADAITTDDDSVRLIGDVLGGVGIVNSSVWWVIQPHGTLGTHTQGLGVQSILQLSIRERYFDYIDILLQSHYSFQLSDLGFMQSRHLGFLGASIVFSLGDVVDGSFTSDFYPLVGKYTHNLILQYHRYFDTIATTQSSGMVAYYYSHSEFVIGLMVENDSLGLELKDRWRTSANELQVFVPIDERQVGFAIGNRIWGGSTEGIVYNSHRGLSFDISSGYGGEYSHGIFYGSVYVENYKISIGWDSEDLRTLFQNGTHFLVNLGDIEPIPNIPDRFFIEIRINPLFALY